MTAPCSRIWRDKGRHVFSEQEVELKHFMLLVCSVIALALFPLRTSMAGHAAGEVLYLSEQPPSDHGNAHGRQGKRGNEQGHGEHRASAERTWYLNLHDLHPGAEAVVLRPDGKRAKGLLSHGKDGWSFVVDTKPLDGSLDGFFNLYVIDRNVSEGTLIVRAPKANMVNHSCGWGHKFKFDEERFRTKYDEAMPLEIVAENLWDRNFHSKTMSGDRLQVNVLRNGRPAPKAQVSFRMGSGWTKTVEADNDGKAAVQLIRDYYPETWSLFDARKFSTVLVTASIEEQQKGLYEGRAYARTRLIATLPWRYVPQRAEYTSYAFGLGIASLFAVASGGGIYAFRARRKKAFQEVDFDERA